MLKSFCIWYLNRHGADVLTGPTEEDALALLLSLDHDTRAPVVLTIIDSLDQQRRKKALGMLTAKWSTRTGALIRRRKPKTAEVPESAPPFPAPPPLPAEEKADAV